MKLKANDTLHVSSAGADNLLAGDEFEVSDAEGAQLIERGLATEVKGGAKAAPAHENKAEPPLENKGVISGASLAPKPARAKAPKA